MNMDISYKKRGVDYELLADRFTLPTEYYQSEAIYQQEIAKIFHQSWLMACREEEIPNPGDYITVPVGDESILLVRDTEGKIRAHFNVCRHRGTRLCSMEKGSFRSHEIQCPYHAWRYHLNGNLKAAPMMKELAGFRTEDYPLFSAYVGLWGGFVFINLAEKPTPFEEDLRPLLGKFQDWHLPELRIAHKIEYSLNCNWKLIIQNYQECYHCPGVHPLLSKWTPFRGAVHDCFEGSVIGGYMEYAEKGGGMTMDGKPASVPVCDVSGPDLQRVHYYSIYPNLLLSPHPDFVLYHRIRSLAIDKIKNDCFFLLHPDVINDKSRMERFQSAIEFWDMTNRQDWHVCEQMQLGLRSRRFKRGPYSGQEDILHSIDKEVLKALGHSPPEKFSPESGTGSI